DGLSGMHNEWHRQISATREKFRADENAIRLHRGAHMALRLYGRGEQQCRQNVILRFLHLRLPGRSWSMSSESSRPSCVSRSWQRDIRNVLASAALRSQHWRTPTQSFTRPTPYGPSGSPTPHTSLGDRSESSEISPADGDVPSHAEC